MFERKEYGLDLGEKTEEKRLPDSPQDPEGQEKQQVENAKHTEENDLNENIGTDLVGLMNSVQNPELGPETGFEDINGRLAMQQLSDEYPPVRLDLGQYTY